MFPLLPAVADGVWQSSGGRGGGGVRAELLLLSAAVTLTYIITEGMFPAAAHPLHAD